MKASDAIKKFIQEHEGLKLTKYICSSGDPTIGYGHKIKRGESFDKITKKQAQEILDADIAQVEGQLTKLGLYLTQGKFDALVSVIFNYGINNFIKTKAYQFIKAGQYSLASHELFSKENGIVYVDGKFSNGLYARRQKELTEFWTK